jgi:transcriptional regulator with XRE-family HTH domain
LLDKNIGIKIRQIRKGWGLSQIELAERMGISFQQIQKYEKGSTRISVMRLKQISDALGVPITSFFEEGNKSPRVTDSTAEYVPKGDAFESFQPINKEEMTLLKLFRKTRNRKVRKGIIAQLRGVIELEHQRKGPARPRNLGGEGAENRK